MKLKQKTVSKLLQIRFKAVLFQFHFVVRTVYGFDAWSRSS